MHPSHAAKVSRQIVLSAYRRTFGYVVDELKPKTNITVIYCVAVTDLPRVQVPVVPHGEPRRPPPEVPLVAARRIVLLPSPLQADLDPARKHFTKPPHFS